MPNQKAKGAKKDANAKMSYALQVRKQNALLNSSLPVERVGIGRIQSQIMSRKGIVSGLRQRRIRRALQQRQNLGDQLLSRSFQDEALPSNRVLEKYKRQLAKGYGQAARLPMDVVHERGSSAEGSLQHSDSDDSYNDVES